MKKRLIIFIALIVILLIGLFVAQKAISKDTTVKEPTTSGKMSQQTGEDGEENPLTFGFSCIDMSDPYYVALEASLRSEIEENGALLSTKDAHLQQEVQNADIEGFIEEDIDALFVVPVTEDGTSEALKKVREAGIPIINLDSRTTLDGEDDVYIGADCEFAGKLCANDLVRRTPDGGNVLILENNFLRSASDAVSGFERALASQGFEVDGRIDCQGSRAKAEAGVISFLNAHGSVTAIFCSSDLMALGANDALARYNEAKESSEQIRPYIYGVGGSPDLKTVLSDASSLMTGTAAKSPISIGQDGADAALKILNGDKFDQEVIIKPYLIDHENINLYGIDGWQ